MWASLTVWTTVCLCSMLAAEQLNIGDICKETTGVQWTCRPLKDCPTALQEAKKGGKLQTCGFTGSDLNVCCEPTVPKAKQSDICKQTTGVQWTCRPLKACPTAVKEVKKGGKLQTCGFTGFDLNVCCEPTGLKAKQMCKKYGEAVFVQLPLPDGEVGETITIDSCTMPNSVPAGSAAHPRSYPHMALIGYGDRGAVEWKCQGSLISEQYILSTARCIFLEYGRDEARWVRLGDYDIQSTEDNQDGRAQPEEYKIDEIIDHPDNGYSLFSSIALFKLNTSVRLSEYIRPVCLHTEEQFNESAIVASGWGVNGKIHTIQEHHMQFVSRMECKKRVTTPILSVWFSLRPEILRERIVCAAGAYVAQPGTLLQVRLQEPYCMYSLVGVAFYPYNINVFERVYIFRRVSHYVPWIESIVWP